MAIETITGIQGDEQWFNHRLASIGGSGIKKVIAKGRNKEPSKTRTTYLFQKADEFITRKRIESYSDENMRLGTDSEPLSRNCYEFETDVKVEQVALIKAGDHKHVSPDGLVGGSGMIEIKNTNGPNYIETIYKDRVPPEHIPQIQWGLSKAEREWCDFIHGCWIRQDGDIVARYINKPIWIKRVYRDEEKIKELDEAADKFLEEMALIVREIKGIA
jgi:hypothetical protein